MMVGAELRVSIGDTRGPRSSRPDCVRSERLRRKGRENTKNYRDTKDSLAKRLASANGFPTKIARYLPIRRRRHHAPLFPYAPCDFAYSAFFSVPLIQTSPFYTSDHLRLPHGSVLPLLSPNFLFRPSLRYLKKRNIRRRGRRVERGLEHSHLSSRTQPNELSAFFARALHSFLDCICPLLDIPFY